MEVTRIPKLSGCTKGKGGAKNISKRRAAPFSEGREEGKAGDRGVGIRVV